MFTIIISVVVFVVVFFSTVKTCKVFPGAGRSWNMFREIRYLPGRFRKGTIQHSIYKSILRLVSGKSSIEKIDNFYIVFRAGAIWTTFDKRLFNRRLPKDYRHRLFYNKQFICRLFVTAQPLNLIRGLGAYLENKEEKNEH